MKEEDRISITTVGNLLGTISVETFCLGSSGHAYSSANTSGSASGSVLTMSQHLPLHLSLDRVLPRPLALRMPLTLAVSLVLPRPLALSMTAFFLPFE